MNDFLQFSNHNYSFWRNILQDESPALVLNSTMDEEDSEVILISQETNIQSKSEIHKSSDFQTFAIEEENFSEEFVRSQTTITIPEANQLGEFFLSDNQHNNYDNTLEEFLNMPASEFLCLAQPLSSQNLLSLNTDMLFDDEI